MRFHLTFEVPIRILSEPNQRSHYMARARRVKKQRADVALAFRAAAGPPPHHAEPPLTITLIRLAPREIADEDNLIAGFKSVRDQIAACLQFDDRDRRVTWVYRQERASGYGVRVTIEARVSSATAR